jgi:peptidyl-prolyl cis-trans isomerase C
MTFKPARLLLASLTMTATFAALPALAENAAVVNGTAIPTSRVDELVKQVTSQPNGPQDTPELRQRIKDELINREVLIQGIDTSGY